MIGHTKQSRESLDISVEQSDLMKSLDRRGFRNATSITKLEKEVKNHEAKIKWPESRLTEAKKEKRKADSEKKAADRNLYYPLLDAFSEWYRTTPVGANGIVYDRWLTILQYINRKYGWNRYFNHYLSLPMKTMMEIWGCNRTGEMYGGIGSVNSLIGFGLLERIRGSYEKNVAPVYRITVPGFSYSMYGYSEFPADEDVKTDSTVSADEEAISKFIPDDDFRIKRKDAQKETQIAFRGVKKNTDTPLMKRAKNTIKKYGKGFGGELTDKELAAKVQCSITTIKNARKQLN